MARFRGTIQGQRGEASRIGNEHSGLTVTCNGWDIGVKCLAFVNEAGQDAIEVYITSGSNDFQMAKYIGTVMQDKKTHGEPKVFFIE